VWLIYEEWIVPQCLSDLICRSKQECYSKMLTENTQKHEFRKNEMQLTIYIYIYELQKMNALSCMKMLWRKLVISHAVLKFHWQESYWKRCKSNYLCQVYFVLLSTWHFLSDPIFHMCIQSICLRWRNVFNLWL
jgi:hypothetical protein